MAFNIKKKSKGKRLPSPTDDVGADTTPDGGTTPPDDSGSDEPQEGITTQLDPIADFPFPIGGIKSNVVATQSWVYKTLMGFWNWTKFFATRAIHVADGLYSKRIKTGELQGDEIYAKRLVLLDPNGKPAVVYIDENGDLKRIYKYSDVFLYCGDGVEAMSYAYRYPDVIANFIGLTPIETMLNFIPYKSNVSKTFNEKDCPKLCEADGVDELLVDTLLFKCNQTKKIVGLKVVDSDGELVRDLEFTPPEGKIIRRLTINMPCFRPADGEPGDPCYVVLPGDILDGYGKFKPFVPPFLKPPFPPPPHFCPPTPPCVPPHVKPTVPPNLSPDIFDDQDIEDGDDLFADIDAEPEETPNQPLQITPGYQVGYENYFTNTYANFTLKRSDFQKNVEQYLMVETIDA